MAVGVRQASFIIFKTADLLGLSKKEKKSSEWKKYFVDERGQRRMPSLFWADSKEPQSNYNFGV